MQTLQGVMQKSLAAQTCQRFLDVSKTSDEPRFCSHSLTSFEMDRAENSSFAELCVFRISKVQHSVQQLMPKHHWMLAVWLWPQSLPEFSEEMQESNRDTPIFGLKCYKMI